MNCRKCNLLCDGPEADRNEEARHTVVSYWCPDCQILFAKMIEDLELETVGGNEECESVEEIEND